MEMDMDMDVLNDRLRQAAIEGNVQNVQFYLNQGALAIGDALLDATLNDRDEVIDLILGDALASWGEYDPNEILEAAAERGNIPLMEIMINAGASPQNINALHRAIQKNQLDAVDFLLAEGRKDFQQEDLREALGYAVDGGKWDIVDLFINEYGISLDPTSDYNRRSKFLNYLSEQANEEKTMLDQTSIGLAQMGFPPDLSKRLALETEYQRLCHDFLSLPRSKVDFIAAWIPSIQREYRSTFNIPNTQNILIGDVMGWLLNFSREEVCEMIRRALPLYGK